MHERRVGSDDGRAFQRPPAAAALTFAATGKCDDLVCLNDKYFAMLLCGVGRVHL